jgi:hypothetical protein
MAMHRGRTIPLIVAGVLLFSACGQQEPPLIPPEGDDAAREATATACSPVTIGAQEFVPAQPEPIEPPRGAGEPEEEGLNEEIPPPVPDSGVDIGDLTESVFAPPRGAEGEERPEDAVVYVHSTVRDPSVSPQVEPEVASNGDRVLMTWNFNAGVSNDGGNSFRYLSPSTTFPDKSEDFWGDQRAEYSATHDIWLWVLMYRKDEAGKNIIRLGVAPGDSVFDGARGTYYDWDIENTGFPAQVQSWFDQPKIGLSARHAFLSFNAYGSLGEGFQGSLVIRVALDGLASGGDPQARCFLPGINPATSRQFFSPYPTRGAADTMYFAAHQDNQTLAIWRWRDDENTVSFRTVVDSFAWPMGTDYDDNSRSDFSCVRVIRGADGSMSESDPTSNWCLRLSDGWAKNDSRITSGWAGGGRIGFAWNIPSYDNPANPGVEVPYPAVWAVRIDEATLDACSQAECIVDHPWLVNEGYAIQYAAIAPNARGDLGAVVLTGGGSSRHDGYLTCMAAIWDQYSGGTWHYLDIAESNDDVSRPSSGDYLGIWPNGGNDATWSAGCMTFEAGFGDVVQFARFARRQDIP